MSINAKFRRKRWEPNINRSQSSFRRRRKRYELNSHDTKQQ